MKRLHMQQALQGLPETILDTRLWTTTCKGLTEICNGSGESTRTKHECQ